MRSSAGCRYKCRYFPAGTFRRCTGTTTDPDRRRIGVTGALHTDAYRGGVDRVHVRLTILVCKSVGGVQNSCTREQHSCMRILPCMPVLRPLPVFPCGARPRPNADCRTTGGRTHPLVHTPRSRPLGWPNIAGKTPTKHAAGPRDRPCRPRISRRVAEGLGLGLGYCLGSGWVWADVQDRICHFDLHRYCN